MKIPCWKYNIPAYSKWFCVFFHRTLFSEKTTSLTKILARYSNFKIGCHTFTYRQICHFPLVFARNWIAQVYITSLFLKIEYFYCIMAQRSPFQDTNAFGKVSHNFKMSKANKLPNSSCWVSNVLIWLYTLWHGHLDNGII